LGRGRGGAQRAIPQGLPLEDAGKADDFTAYKLPIADVIDGKLKAVPRAVMAAAQVLQGARAVLICPRRTWPR
jgi:hypothetical protein